MQTAVMKKKRSSFSVLGALSLLVALVVVGSGGLVVLAEEPAEAVSLPGDNTVKKIAFERDEGVAKSNPTGDSEIYTMNPNGTGTKRLTFNTRDDFYPAWSPDGTEIAFQSDRDGNPFNEIYKMKADGTNQTNLTNNSADDQQPDWQSFFLRIFLPW
jgi:Tol biopolymer transport system component